MMESKARFFALASALILLGGCKDKLPTLLHGATSGGGVGYECKEGIDPASLPNLSKSPELSNRLRQQFPAGSPASELEEALAEQSFVLHGPCSPDQSIQWAQFRRNRNEVVANVYWRVDEKNEIVWTLGAVSYTFL